MEASGDIGQHKQVPTRRRVHAACSLGAGGELGTQARGSAGDSRRAVMPHCDYKEKPNKLACPVKLIPGV